MELRLSGQAVAHSVEQMWEAAKAWCNPKHLTFLLYWPCQVHIARSITDGALIKASRVNSLRKRGTLSPDVLCKAAPSVGLDPVR